MLGRILVTGGAGFIGSHVCKALAAQGYVPVTYDNLSRGHSDAVRWGPLIVGDICDQETLAAALGAYRPVAVIHLAGLAYVGESVEDPGPYYVSNVAGTASLLGAMRRARIGNLVFSSSCATYGVAGTLPIREDSPQTPINPYGRTKLMAEQMIGDHAAAYGSSHVMLRYFNACGADPEGELAERHDPETHLIPRALMASAGIIPVLEILGDDYPTPDGTCIRDYIHVSDLADAHVQAVQHLLRGGESLACNLGTGRGLSIREIVDVVSLMTGRKVPTTVKPRRPGDPPELYADAELARRVLRFQPSRSDLATIVRTAWQSMQTQWEAAARPVPRAAAR